MKKSLAHRKLALAASKQGCRVQIHRNASTNNCRIVAPDGTAYSTTLVLDASKGYTEESVMEAVRDIRKLNCSSDAAQAGIDNFLMKYPRAEEIVDIILRPEEEYGDSTIIATLELKDEVRPFFYNNFPRVGAPYFTLFSDGRVCKTTSTRPKGYAPQGAWIHHYRPVPFQKIYNETISAIDEGRLDDF